MREGSISSTPLVSECGSVTSETFLHHLREKSRENCSHNGIKPHPAAPVTNFFDSSLKKTTLAIRQRPSGKGDVHKRENFVQHRSLLKKSMLTKKLRAATISNYSYAPKSPGV